MDIENMSIEKATERCKALTNPEQGCWIGISNQKAIEIVLEELENKQDDINILQAQRDSMEYQFKQAKSELEKKDTEIIEAKEANRQLSLELEKKEAIINEMAEQLAGLAIFDIEKDEPLILGDKEEVKEYFTKKVEGK